MVRRRMARMGVAVAAVASLGLGGGLAVTMAAPAGAAQAAAATSPTQTIDELLANTEGAVANVEATVNNLNLLPLVEDVVCLVVAPLAGADGRLCIIG